MKGLRLLGGPVHEYGRYATRHILALVGGFVTLAAFVSIITSEGLRRWINTHPYPIFLALVAALLLIALTVTYAHSLEERYRKLHLATKSREKARAKSREADALFELLAFFAPGPVDEDLLLGAGDVGAPTEELQHILTNPDYLRSAVIELSHMSLAELDRSKRSIHVQRIAQAIARGHLSITDPDSAQSLEKLAQSILAASDPRAPDRDDAEEIYRKSRRHLVASGALQSSDPLVRQLVINQIRRLYRAGGFNEGVSLGKVSLRHWQETSGSNDRQTLALAVEVGSALRRLGRWKEAMSLNLDTLERLRSLYGATDQIYLLCARSYGTDLALLGDYAKALENDQQLLPLYKDTFGRHHLDTLQLRNNIAISMRCLGKFEEALKYDRNTFLERQGIVGNEDTSTLTSRFAIARDLRMLGRAQEGHEILVDISSILTRKFTVSQQFELLIGADLAVSLRGCGHYQEALTQAEESFREYNVVFGPEHRDTLTTGINVINDLRITNHLSPARTLGERIVAGWTSIVGADHPNTLAAQVNLACVLRAEGNPKASLHIDEPAVQKLTGLFGDAHPNTLAVMTNLASDLAMIGETRQARLVSERSFRLHTESRGHEHPSTLATAANLSLDRRGDGDHSLADELHATTLRACEGTFGSEHPESKKIAQYGRMTLDIEPMMD